MGLGTFVIAIGLVAALATIFTLPSYVMFETVVENLLIPVILIAIGYGITRKGDRLMNEAIPKRLKEKFGGEPTQKEFETERWGEKPSNGSNNKL